MGNFYNPYSKNPAWGQGIGDTFSQILQMLMMKKYMGNQGQGMPGRPTPQAVMPTSPYTQNPVNIPSMGGGGGMGQADVRANDSLYQIMMALMGMGK